MVPLPKIDSPVYELDLPLSKIHIKFRPFLVKEQRNLMMAIEANDIDTAERNIKQVLQNCTLTQDINIEKLPLLDVEYYFLNLRARSVGEMVENKYKCVNMVGDKQCGNVIDIKVNLLDIKPEFPPNISDTVKLTDKISVKLKYPEFSVMKRVKDSSNVSDFAFTLIAESIESIFDGEQMYYANEYKPSELVDFVESLGQEEFSKLEEFFENLPKLRKKIELKCSKCNHEHTLDVEGLESFFA
jgi:hypothetical protein